jgi:hypothetical protein
MVIIPIKGKVLHRFRFTYYINHNFSKPKPATASLNWGFIYCIYRSNQRNTAIGVIKEGMGISCTLYWLDTILYTSWKHLPDLRLYSVQALKQLAWPLWHWFSQKMNSPALYQRRFIVLLSLSKKMNSPVLSSRLILRMEWGTLLSTLFLNNPYTSTRLPEPRFQSRVIQIHSPKHSALNTDCFNR